MSTYFPVQFFTISYDNNGTSIIECILCVQYSMLLFSLITMELVIERLLCVQTTTRVAATRACLDVPRQGMVGASLAAVHPVMCL